MIPKSFPNQYFWQEVYIAAIRRGSDSSLAKTIADNALHALKLTIINETKDVPHAQS